MTLRLRLLYFLSLCLAPAFAQQIQREVTATAGGFANAGSVMLESNIGEFFIETYTGSPGILTQGFLQPDTLLSTLVAEARPDVDGKAYPNPVSSALFLDLGTENYKDLHIMVMDVLGALHAATVVYSGNGTYQVDLGGFRPGVYFVRVEAPSAGYSRVFKISRM